MKFQTQKSDKCYTRNQQSCKFQFQLLGSKYIKKQQNFKNIFFLVISLFFVSFSSKDTESLKWFNILETKDVKLIKESFKDKYVDFINSKNQNSIIYVSRNDTIHSTSKAIYEQTDYQAIKFLLEKGVNPNHIDNQNNTYLDYLIKMKEGASYYMRLLYKYNPKRACEIKGSLCSKGFIKRDVLHGIFIGIEKRKTLDYSL